jgi:hypothetical protein
MYGNYESRKVARDEFAWGFISTARVTDGEFDYETAVKHKDYNNDEMVVVESYETKQQALNGHAKWVKKMTARRLPTALKDCANAGLSKLLVGMGYEMTYKRATKKRKAA